MYSFNLCNFFLALIYNFLFRLDGSENDNIVLSTSNVIPYFKYLCILVFDLKEKKKSVCSEYYILQIRFATTGKFLSPRDEATCICIES